MALKRMIDAVKSVQICGFCDNLHPVFIIFNALDQTVVPDRLCL